MLASQGSISTSFRHGLVSPSGVKALTDETRCSMVLTRLLPHRKENIRCWWENSLQVSIERTTTTHEFVKCVNYEMWGCESLETKSMNHHMWFEILNDFLGDLLLGNLLNPVEYCCYTYCSADLLGIIISFSDEIKKKKETVICFISSMTYVHVRSIVISCL